MATISERITSKKRHTLGYVVDGETYTRAQTIRLARRGEIEGVRVANGPQGPYIVSSTETSLYTLPIRVVSKRPRRTTAAKGRKTTATKANGQKAR